MHLLSLSHGADSVHSDDTGRAQMHQDHAKGCRCGKGGRTRAFLQHRAWQYKHRFEGAE